MKKPQPAVGLVIRYDYLWRDEARRGRQEGAKDRPCTVVIARSGDGPDAMVWLAPITHTPPTDPKAAVEIPPKLKAYLGLDDARSWIVTSEINSVAWSDPGIVPVGKSRWDYGLLPPKFTKAVVDRMVEWFKAKRLGTVDRVRIEQRR